MFDLGNWSGDYTRNIVWLVYLKYSFSSWTIININYTGILKSLVLNHAYLLEIYFQLIIMNISNTSSTYSY
jgi:hypothetical protein